MIKGQIIRCSAAGGACFLSAVTRILAVLRVRSPSVAGLLGLFGFGLSARSSLFVSAMISSCFSNEANTTTQHGLVA